MNQAFVSSTAEQIDEDVVHSLRVIRQQRTLKFAGVTLVAVLGVVALFVTTYLGL